MKDFSRLAVVAVFLALAAASANAFKMGWEVETDGSVMRPGSELSIKQAFHVGAYWKLTVDDPKGKYQKCFPVNAIKNGKVRLETGQDQAVSQAQPNFRQMFRFQRVRSRLGQGGSQVPSVPPPPPGPPPSLDQKPKKQQKQKQKSKAPSQVEPKCNYGFIELVSKPIKQTVADVNGALKEIGQWWKNTKDLSKSSVTVFGFGSLGYQTDLLLSTSDAKVQFTVGYSLFKLDKLAAGNGPLSKMWDGFPEAYTKVTSEFDTSAPNKNIIKNFLAVWYWVFSKYVSIQGDHIGKGQMNVNVKMDFCEWVDVMKRGGLLRDSDVEDIKTFMKKFESHPGLVGDEKKKKALGVAKGERQCFMISNDNTRVKPTVENGDVDVVVEYRINNNSPCFQLILDVYKNPASVDNDQKLNRRISQCLMDLSFPGLADEIAAYNKVIQTSVKTKESLKDADLELSEIATTQEELLKEIEKMDASQVKIGDAIVGTPAYDGLKTRVNKIKEIFNNLKVPITI